MAEEAKGGSRKEDAREQRREFMLISSDYESFRVGGALRDVSKLLEVSVPDDFKGVQEITLQVPSIILSKVIEFCRHYQEHERMNEITKPLQTNNLRDIVQEFYASFIDYDDTDLLFQMTAAANYMDIPPLLDLCCAAVACKIKGKTTEQIRHEFDITNDFTPEEEEKVRAENAWAEET